MTWYVQLRFTDCANGGPIGGVWITDGVNTYTGDAFGQFLAAVHDDEAEAYGFKLSHTSYVTKHITLTQAMTGTTETFCLDAAGPGTGTFTGW